MLLTSSNNLLPNGHRELKAGNKLTITLSEEKYLGQLNTQQATNEKSLPETLNSYLLSSLTPHIHADMPTLKETYVY